MGRNRRNPTGTSGKHADVAGVAAGSVKSVQSRMALDLQSWHVKSGVEIRPRVRVQ